MPIQVAPIKPTISIDVLEKIDIRLGTIEQVDDVTGSDKLVRLTVDFGNHKRRIVAGLKQERQNLAAIIGVQTLFVVNLAPKRIRGEISEGMLFDAGYADGLTPLFLIPERRAPNGIRAT
ncbi:MAG TPA: hypothetical protein VJ124_14915 [Pyrinomonadaceae bacterium]|nr:hypothetical protein [Pyrinomonadaceae bacterium]